MTAIDQLKSVLCDPEGKCCIAGSDEDRAIIDRALDALAQPVHKHDAAIKTLEHLKYTYHGGEYWKPPLGKVKALALPEQTNTRPYYTIDELNAWADEKESRRTHD